MALALLIFIVGWGHWSFYLWTPAVATRAAIEKEYGELLAKLREYGRRIPTDGSDKVGIAIDADPVVQEWCNRSEVLAVVLRLDPDGPHSDVYVDGFPPELIDAHWFRSIRVRHVLGERRRE
jgi:hypothetical protein